MMDKEDKVYQDTDRFRLTAVGPFFKLDLGELSREEFWDIVEAICKEWSTAYGED